MNIGPKRIRGQWAALLIALSLTLSGCTGNDPGTQPTETQTAAIARVEQLVADASAHLPAGTTLENDYRMDELACDDPADGGPAGRLFVEHRYLLISSESTGAWHSDQVTPPLVAYWQTQNYHLNDDSRTKPSPRYSVETSDGYRATIDGYNRGGYFDYVLTVGSPCIWRNGTPEPK